MKIRNQLRLFMAGIIVAPVLCALFFPIYHYLTRPEKMLMRGTEQIRRMSSLPLTERDTEEIKDMMRKMPPKVEFMLISESWGVLMTNFPEFEGEAKIDKNSFLDYMASTSGDYFYQLVRPPLHDEAEEILLASRVPLSEDMGKKHEKKFLDGMLPVLLVFLAVFEAFCITLTLFISNTITRSITALEKDTERIASGDLDVEFTAGDAKRENEITRLNGNLDKMRLALKDSAERRARLIMGVSHDLRTPVAVIKGYTEAMSDGVFGECGKMEKPVKIISEKAEQLESMINDLITFVRLNDTDWKNSLRRQRLRPFLEELSRNSVTTGQIFRRNVVTKIEIGEDTEAAFDEMLLGRALENLFTNAVRYTSEGDKIEIEATESNGRILLKIRDEGAGIDKKDLDKIFDLFYRGTNSRREGGMGIGLSVVRSIVATHGWEISVQSQKGVGTEFTIEIVP